MRNETELRLALDTLERVLAMGVFDGDPEHHAVLSGEVAALRWALRDERVTGPAGLDETLRGIRRVLADMDRARAILAGDPLTN